MVSVKRLQKFMLYEEINKTSEKTKSTRKESNVGRNKNDVYNKENDTSDKKGETENTSSNYQGEHIISLKNANAKWFSYEQEDTLKNININVKPGELVAVVGHVGSGKSSLLNVLLKELPVNSGTVEVRVVFLDNYSSFVLNNEVIASISFRFTD